MHTSNTRVHGTKLMKKNRDLRIVEFGKMNTLTQKDFTPAGSTFAGGVHDRAGKNVQRATAMRILLADDHSMVRETISAYLESEGRAAVVAVEDYYDCLLYTSPSPRDQRGSRMPSSA